MGKKSEKEKLSEVKTNVMRILEQAKIPYQHYCYADLGVTAGVEVAAAMGQDPRRVFKTLVTVGKTGTHYVFVIPVEKELNLRKAAKAVGEKSVEMIKAKELLPLTGYVHGGCSPIGMKKLFRTVVDVSARDQQTMFFSGGKIGYQVEVTLENLQSVIPLSLAELTD